MSRRGVVLAVLLALALGSVGAGSAAASPSRREPRGPGVGRDLPAELRMTLDLLAGDPGAAWRDAAPAVTIDTPADLSVRRVGDVVVLTAGVRGAGVARCLVRWGDGTGAAVAAREGRCRAGHRYLTRGTQDVAVTVFGPAGSARDTATLVLVDPGTTVVGAGSVAGGTSFGLAGVPTSFGPVGQVEIRTPDGHVFHGTPLAVVVAGRTATWWGAGRLDATDRCGFRVTLADAGVRGDRVRLVVTSPAGTTLVRVAGPLATGGVDVRPR
jgi:hypothetical protein